MRAALLEPDSAQLLLGVLAPPFPRLVVRLLLRLVARTVGP